ncbi:HPF/RaiA family ribosome-associated protein [Nitriliruptor alkaliphilus]|uniref:HPF/RaiA family ribosome-associated protein n=1 Tax=Nitriliruptor alkaliphilus TaxID=427918 RepID=UPI000696A6E6|nr:HPF/RaiA family ribosome-associated protein [Nitriliruptor alkaliphilus]
MSESESIVAERLRIVSEFREDEREYILAQLGTKLDRRLVRYGADKVELELSIKERDTPSQKVVLECWITGEPRMVATSNETDLQSALHDVREDLFKQIDKHVNKRQDRARR